MGKFHQDWVKSVVSLVFRICAGNQILNQHVKINNCEKDHQDIY